MKIKRSDVAVAVLNAVALMAAGAAHAQSEPQKVDRVEITGSSIKRIDAESALPVQVVTRADIERTGATSVAELVQALPAMQGFTQVSQSVGAGGAGYSDASIHNIGGTRTLVLLNGKRVASWAGQTLTGAGSGIDLNAIPISAIDRVEILTDGASALYGTDAIAGVVNFILRNNLTSGDVSVNVTYPRGGTGQNTKIAATKGWGDLQKDGYNVMLSGAYDRQEQMKATDRAFSATGVIPFSKDGKNYVFFNGSIRGVPGNYEIVDVATQGEDRDILGNWYYAKNGKCPPVHVYRGGACRFDYTSTIETIPESDRTSFFGSFSKALSGGHTLGIDFALSQFKLISRIAPPPVDIKVPTGSALYNRYMPGGANVLHPDAVYGDDLYAYWRGVDVGNRTTQDKTTAAHIAASLKGAVAGWDYTASFTHSENKWVESYLSGWLMQKEQDAALAAGAFDPFLEPGKQSAAGNAALAGMQYRGVYKSQVSKLDGLEANASRPLFKLSGGDAQIGVGLSIRRESLKYTPSAIAQGQTNSIAGDTAQEVPYDVSRNIWGIYGEFVAPVSKQLEVSAALRHDQYGDFGGANNGKLSFRFQPNRQVLVRGSVGTGFRAPSVPQVSAGRQLYGVTGDTYNCPTNALAAMRKVDPLATCHPDGLQYEIIAQGNKDLKPEKSEQFSLGFRLEPASWLSAGADLWGVRIKDRITQLTEATVMGNDAAYLKNFTIFVDPGTGKHYVALFLPNENLGKERYLGLDADIKTTFDTRLGRLTSTLQWTHMFNYEYQRLKDGPYFSNLGTYNDAGVTFRNIIRLANTLKHDRFEHTLAVNYKSGYEDQACSAAECGLVRNVNANGSVGSVVSMSGLRVSSYTTVDWQTRFDYNKRFSVTAGVLNVFDQDPPLSLKRDGGHQLGYDNRYTDPRGRTFYANLSYKF